jgi:hypothetical protein
VESAPANEVPFVPALFDSLRARGFQPETCAMDKGYDAGSAYEACVERGCLPIIPLRRTPGVVRGDHQPPYSEHGTWRFAGADYGRSATTWRCPTGECEPASRWIKAGRLIR